jgi:hypothetical protein
LRSAANLRVVAGRRLQLFLRERKNFGDNNNFLKLVVASAAKKFYILPNSGMR